MGIYPGMLIDKELHLTPKIPIMSASIINWIYGVGKPVSSS